MREIKQTCENEELLKLCNKVRELISAADYNNCYDIICLAMRVFPDAPHPHNLLGILLEQKGQHAAAMRHFRAAYALDPTYLPARQNLESFGTFYSSGDCAFDESDCIPKQTNQTVKHNVGFVVRKGCVK